MWTYFYVMRKKPIQLKRILTNFQEIEKKRKIVKKRNWSEQKNKKKKREWKDIFLAEFERVSSFTFCYKVAEISLVTVLTEKRLWRSFVRSSPRTQIPRFTIFRGKHFSNKTRIFFFSLVDVLTILSEMCSYCCLKNSTYLLHFVFSFYKKREVIFLHE